jgi:hypothetical protein
MMATPVTSHVNNVHHDDPACLEPASTVQAGGDQAQLSFGL